MSAKDRERLKVLHEVRKRHITQVQAAKELNLDKIDVPVRIETHTRPNLLQDWGMNAVLRALNKPVDLIMHPRCSTCCVQTS